MVVLDCKLFMLRVHMCIDMFGYVLAAVDVRRSLELGSPASMAFRWGMMFAGSLVVLHRISAVCCYCCYS